MRFSPRARSQWPTSLEENRPPRAGRVGPSVRTPSSWLHRWGRAPLPRTLYSMSSTQRTQRASILLLGVCHVR